jgi:hypothetical protein
MVGMSRRAMIVTVREMAPVPKNVFILPEVQLELLGMRTMWISWA